MEKLKAKGIKKFIGYEVPLELCQKRYGEHYPVVLNDLRQSDDLRVLDYDGHHIMLTFSFKELGQPFTYGERGEGHLSSGCFPGRPGFQRRAFFCTQSSGSAPDQHLTFPSPEPVSPNGQSCH